MQRLKYLLILGAIVALYYWLKTAPYGQQVIYPFALMGTILHEFGHGLLAILTGGKISSIQINSDGSGLTWSAGGSRLLTLMGGYVGSAIFGNLLLRAGLVHAKWSNFVLSILLAVLIAICTIWSASLANTLLVAVFAVAIYLVSRTHHAVASWFLVVTGTITLLYIIEDFNVGPTSDLENFAQILPILPRDGWMIAWLLLVLAITAMNVKGILASESE